MNTYIVYLAETGEKVASGKAEECAQALGLKNKRVFWETIREIKNGGNHKYKIEIFGPNGKPDPMRCPCDSCLKQPEGRGHEVSWACEEHCISWLNWAKKYWKGLNEKYGRH